MPSPSKTIFALLFATFVVAMPTPQLAGEGAAFNSLFSDIDNGVGYGIENAEDNLAANIASLKGSSNVGPRTRRQLDKISNGFQSIGNSMGVGSSTSGTTTMLDDVDGELTSGAANLGADTGSLLESMLESAGKGVPRV